MHLGLADIVFRQGMNFNQPSTVPPRVLPIPNTFIDREERVRAYWMSEALDSISMLGVVSYVCIHTASVTDRLVNSYD